MPEKHGYKNIAIKLVFLSVLGILSLGQYAVVGKDTGLNLYLFDAMIALFVVVGLVSLVMSKKKLTLPKIGYFFLLFVGAGLVSLVANISDYVEIQYLVSFLYLLRLLMYLLVYVVLSNFIKHDILDFKFILRGIVWSGVLLTVFGFFQLIVLPDFAKLDPALGWDPHKNRMTSTFFDPNFFGAYIVLCYYLLIFGYETKIYTHKTALIISGLFSLAILLTFSRSAWLMLAIGLLLFGMFRNRKVIFYAIVLFFLIYFLIPRVQTRITGTTDPADSAQFRFVSWNQTLQIIKDHPLFGVGYNRMRYVNYEYGFTNLDSKYKHSASGSDSSALFILATTGILGASVFFYAFGSAIKKTYLWSGKNAAILALYISLIFGSQFINSLFYPQILFIWLVVTSFSSVSNRLY